MARGNVLLPLDEAAVAVLVPELRADAYRSVALGYLHSYADGAHERRTRDILLAHRPDLSVTMSSEVCPEIREYERWSTACANAYVQPVMDRYLKSPGGRAQSARFRLPALADHLGRRTDHARDRAQISDPPGRVRPGRRRHSRRQPRAAVRARPVVSFDMGGTTAKICLIDDGQPQYSRTFEVARQYRFLKGSGMPIRIPVIEMVEIGAGGGSIASVDSLARVNVGPESAGSEPGPACYGRGGTRPRSPTPIVVLGRLDPNYFAGGSIKLDRGARRHRGRQGDRRAARLAATASCVRRSARSSKKTWRTRRACTRWSAARIWKRAP